MDKNLKALSPAAVWKHFERIAAIPHPSHHEEKIRRYILDFAAEHGLEHVEDEAHNVYIRKPATKGMENRKGIIMQAHLDMVPQKNNDKQFDFENENLEHGDIEALFTATEETGMDGAFGLKAGLLKGEILLNLDSETEGELYVGCAGGLGAKIAFKYAADPLPARQRQQAPVPSAASGVALLRAGTGIGRRRRSAQRHTARGDGRCCHA